MNELFSLEGKIVVLTGGSGVLGKSIARHFATEGAKVMVIARNKERGEALVEEISSEGGCARFFQGDVTKLEEMQGIYEQVIQDFKRVDVLINAAGGNMSGATIAPDQSIFDLDMAAMRQVVDLNLFGTVIPTQVFARSMAEQGSGSIINVASEAALRPLTRVVGYAAAKAAVVNFTKYLCTELATKFGEGIRVNAIAPGFFLTEQNRTLLTNPDGSLTARGEAIIAHTPFKRFGRPEELLGTLQWLSSDASSFVSGTLTVIDGGFDAFSI